MMRIERRGHAGPPLATTPGAPHIGPMRESLAADRLIELCFDTSPAVRYVAVYSRGTLRMRERAGVQNASAGETDRYEELLVNPALVTLARQRGEIDCGGLTYILIRYGHFFTSIHPLPDGHVNVGFELDVDLDQALRAVRDVIAGWAAEPAS